jgi:two-component system response regulator FixJ
MTEHTEPIVHIVDDDDAVRDSLRMLFYSVGLEAVTYASAADFLERADLVRPGCLIVDVRMPGKSGLELQKELVDRDIPLPIIVITAHGTTSMAVGALRTGAYDFIEKPYDDQHLIDSVHQALEQAKRLHHDHERADLARACHDQLTPREREVMAMVVTGDSNKVIAHRLGISQRTVEIHRARVMDKFQARNLMDLMRKAQLLGLDTA